MVGEPCDDFSPSAAPKMVVGVVKRGLCACPIMNVSRREAGVSKVRNSLVGEIVLGGRSLRSVSAGTRFPLRLERARGSMDLRRLRPPRGTREVSTA